MQKINPTYKPLYQRRIKTFRSITLPISVTFNKSVRKCIFPITSYPYYLLSSSPWHFLHSLPKTPLPPATQGSHSTIAPDARTTAIRSPRRVRSRWNMLASQGIGRAIVDMIDRKQRTSCYYTYVLQVYCEYISPLFRYISHDPLLRIE